MDNVDKFKFKFVGGPKDGLELDSELQGIPTVIDGKSIHYYGYDAYVLIAVNPDERIAIFEHSLLV